MVTPTSPSALGHADEARAILEANRDLRGVAQADRVAGDVLRKLGRLDEAADRLRVALDTARAAGSVEELTASLGNLGLVERDRGDLAAASRAHREAYEAGAAAGYRNIELFAASNLADSLMRDGSPDARLWGERALRLATEMGNEAVRADSLDTLARVALSEGRTNEAAELAEQSAASYAAVEELDTVRAAWELAAQAWEAAGDGARADAARARALEVGP